MQAETSKNLVFCSFVLSLGQESKIFIVNFLHVQDIQENWNTVSLLSYCKEELRIKKDKGQCIKVKPISNSEVMQDMNSINK